MEQWEVATDDLMKLREIIDSDSFAPILQQLQQRTWLMHWSLYIFFNHDNGRNQIIDLFFQDRCTALPPATAPAVTRRGRCLPCMYPRC